jgi:hypothetical protein
MKKILFILLFMPLFLKAQTSYLTKSVNERATDSTGNITISVVDTIYKNSAKDSIVFTVSGIRYAIRDSIGSGGGGSLSVLTPATSTNSINNANFKQRWLFNTIAGDTAFALLSNSTTAASNLQNVFTVGLSGANANSTQTTKAGIFSNTHTGSSSTNIALELNASGGTTNTALNITGGNIQLASSNAINFNSALSGIRYNGAGFTEYYGGTASHLFTSTDVRCFAIASTTATNYFTIAKPTSTTNSIIFNGDFLGAGYRGELTTSNVINSASGILRFAANSGQAGGFAGFTPNYVLSLKPSTSINLAPITATAASAITPAEGDMVFVSNTNATFTSIGFWGYQNGAWIKM